MRAFLRTLYRFKFLKRFVPSLMKLIVKLASIKNVKIKHDQINLNLNLNLNNPIDREIYLKNIYEHKQLKFLSQQIEINNFDIFLDIGAHMGFYSLKLSTKNLDVYSFEPIIENYEQLKKNKEDNKFSKMRIFNIALSNQKKSIKMWVPDKNRTGGFSIYDQNDEEIKKYDKDKIYEKECKSELGDNILDFKKQKIAIKIDVERHEKNVLKGLKNLLNNNQIILQIELFDKRKKDIFNQLKKMNFIHFNTIEKDYNFKNFNHLDKSI